MIKVGKGSISEKIENKVFEPFKNWAEESTDNWNMLIGIGFVLFIIAVILLFVYTVKIGKTDERTNQILLKCTLIMLFGIILCDIIFPKDYMWEIFFLIKYDIAFITSGLYLAVRYKRDVS